MLKRSKLPQHIAFIPDGNIRWAKKNKVSSAEGHRRGVEALEKVLDYCSELGVKIVSVYAFSSENWKRPAHEKKALFHLIEEFFTTRIDKIIKKNSRIKIIGDISKFSQKIQVILKESEKQSMKNNKFLIQIALNYGGRDEIIRAFKKMHLDINDKKLDLKKINEKVLSSYLDTGKTPDPDLLIRTGNCYRISNYLLYQLSYSEFYFCDTLWPDFKESHIDLALASFYRRERRYGARL